MKKKTNCATLKSKNKYFTDIKSLFISINNIDINELVVSHNISFGTKKI